VSHGIIATAEKQEVAQQLAQDGDAQVEICGLIVAIVFKVP